MERTVMRSIKSVAGRFSKNSEEKLTVQFPLSSTEMSRKVVPSGITANCPASVGPAISCWIIKSGISFADVNKVSFDHIKVRLFPANDRRKGEAVYSCRSCFCSFVALINRFNLGVMRSVIKIRCARYLIRSLKQYWLDLGGINRRNI